MKINKPLFDRIAREAVQIRRDIHKHPEVGFREFRTSALIAEYLKSCGIETITGVGKTGVLGILKGNGRSRKSVGFRADIDALRMEEHTNLPYRSVNKGVAHACGHDGNTATLLGAAKYLSNIRRKIPGSVTFLFQPAEEGYGGAQGVCKDRKWIVNRPDMLFAQHGWPLLKKGKVGLRLGTFFASAGEFSISIRGKGGHGSRPDLTIDPVNAAAHLVVALNSIKARENNPFEPMTLSVAQIHAGTTFNVIPDKAEICGTIRSFSEVQQKAIAKRIKDIAKNVCGTLGCTVRTKMDLSYPVTINHSSAFQVAQNAFYKVFGKSKLDTSVSPTMGAEDFSFYGKSIPCAYFVVGMGPTPYGNHNSKFNYDDSILPTGMKAWLSIVDEFFKK